MASNNSSNRGKDKWELTPYELQRTPHELITDDTEISVPLEALHNELKCPICLDLLNKTMAAKCLHRFCSVCIVTSLRAGNNKCPTCRTKLISKRCLRPDPNLDEFISKIYPNREEFNAERNKMMEYLNQSQSQGNMVKSITEGLQEQKRNRSYNTKNKRRPRKAKSTSLNNSAPSTSSQVDNNVKAETNGPKKMKMTSATVSSGIAECDGAFNSLSLNDMELVLKPHPKEMHNNNQLEKDLNKTDLRYIKAPPASTVEHLRKYLTMRLNLDHGKELGNGHHVLIYISQTDDQYVLLDNSLTLQNVQEKFWNVKKEKPMEIFYSYN